MKKIRKPENKVKAEIKKILDRLGIFHRAYVASAYEKGGFPDRLCCVPIKALGIGFFLTIEAKTKGKEATPLQTEVMQDIRNCHGITLLVDESNLEFLEPWLYWLMNGCSNFSLLRYSIDMVQNSPVGFVETIKPFVV